MKQEAQKQKQQISLDKIKEKIKQLAPDKFDKMLISSDTKVTRGDFWYIEMKCQIVDRNIKKVVFPLSTEFKKSFLDLEGGKPKFGERCLLPSESIIDSLQRNKAHFLQLLPKDINISSPFEFPMDLENGEVAVKQKKYFFPDLTYQSECSECHGKKYITCQDSDCEGRHTWKCGECGGDGKNECQACDGDGKVTCKTCKGEKNVPCGTGAGNVLKRNLLGNFAGGGCGGTGRVKDAEAHGGQRKCATCQGKGTLPCETCEKKGTLMCEECQGKGTLKCGECSGKGTLTCEHCYGDKDRYGLIDCPDCSAIGIVSQIVYVEGIVSEKKLHRTILQGDNIALGTSFQIEAYLDKHVKGEKNFNLLYKKANDLIVENEDEEFVLKNVKDLEKQINFSKQDFPLLSKEEVYYQILPCVKASYKHIFTGTLHEFIIVDFWNNPEVVFLSEPEVLKQDLKNVTKSVTGFFSKLFKTKGHKTKEDKKNEITLLIYLAKADGEIEEGEKAYLSEVISGLDDFTNTEKQKLFDLVTAKVLPELTKSDTTFSSKERANEVLEKLAQLAAADGELEDVERNFIEKVRRLIN